MEESTGQTRADVVPPADEAANGSPRVGPDSDAAGRWQFGLADLFLLTTGIAAATSLAIWKSIGTLPLSLGAITILFKLARRGPFADGIGAQRKWVTAAWLLFAVSLLLPVGKGCNNKMIYGWQASSMAAGAEVDMIRKAATAEDDSEFWTDPAQTVMGVLFFTSINLGNLAMLLLPLWYWIGKRRGYVEPPAWCAGVIVLSATSAAIFGWDNGTMLVGYYVWCLSFLVLLVSLKIRWWMVGMMVGYGAAVWGLNVR
ncbi:MAG: hypothetical protein KDA59_03765 [Planctomycetales bacterium]|nr:hypothetical protein [Planctomycetales bacterium]MCA9221260.1 hypothetical protein [Planctomycetales bacterium]